MNKKIALRILKYTLFIGLVGLFAAVFIPRGYPFPAQQIRAGTRYWTLPNGSNIAYFKVDGKGKKQPYPIIYLHGGPGACVSDFNIGILSQVAQDGYDIYFYDQIGGGLSARLEDIAAYTVSRHKADLEAIINTIGTEKVILLGQSWGGTLAAHFGAEHADKIDRIIFTCPGPLFPASNATVSAPDSLQLRAPLFTNAMGNRKSSNLRTKMMAYLATAFNIKLASDKEADAFATFLNAELNKSLVCDPSKAPQPVSGNGYYSSVKTVQNFFENTPASPNFEKADYPVLIMKGQCDNQSWSATNQYLTAFKQHQFDLIPNAGHGIAIEQPDLYLHAIRLFLGKH